jgi:uncharacterized protein YoxC
VNTETILIAMVGIAAFAVLLQAGVLLAILISINKAAKIAGSKADELRSSVIPVLENSRELLQSTHALIARIEPRFDAAAEDLAEITHTARAQAVRFESTANDIHERVHRQAARLDGMATSVLDSVDYASRKVNDAVRGPARRISGAIAAVNAFVESFSKSAPHKHAPEPASTPAPEDKDVAV